MTISKLLTLPLLLSLASQVQSDTSTLVGSTLEFGPCHEFIGGYYVQEETARNLVPKEYKLDTKENGVIAQVRAISCESITITSDDGTRVDGGEHVLYQLGVAVLPPVVLNDNPYLEGSSKVTEYHAYAYNTLTNFNPLAEALKKAGIDGVYYADNLRLIIEDSNPDSCEFIKVEGIVDSPTELVLSFSGTVRDPGTSSDDGCEFGDNDITVSERAVWYTDGNFGTSISDTSVPNSQRLLFNADPGTYKPYPVTYTPMGEKMKAMAGADLEQFSFTMSGLLERGEVFTILRQVSEQ